MFSTRAATALALALFTIVTFTPAAPQDSATGSIRGTVFDFASGRIAQASIVVVNTATGMRYTATSDAAGRFALDLLPSGDYSARVAAQGMSPQVTPPMHVDIGGSSELEFRLTVAGVQESLTVSAAPALVETQPSAVSTLLDERAVNDFPLNGRRFSDLALFSPGVSQDPRSLTSATNGDLSFGGIRGFQNSFLVDGGDYNNAFFAQARGRYRTPYNFSTEVVQEFRVSSNSYGAEQGRAGGAVVNVVTKSGSNHLHGTVFYFCGTVLSALPIRSSPSSLTIASSKWGAPSAALSSATRFSSSPDSTSTSFMFPTWWNSWMAALKSSRRKEPGLTLPETTRRPIKRWCSLPPDSSHPWPESIPPRRSATPLMPSLTLT
jgi:hypothetical protein